MRADEAFPSKYLKSSDVKDKPRIAVISHIEREQIGKGENAQEKYVLYFEGDISPMVLNRTNWEAIEDAFGDSDNWSGHKVKIKTARVQFQGKSCASAPKLQVCCEGPVCYTIVGRGRGTDGLPQVQNRRDCHHQARAQSQRAGRRL